MYTTTITESDSVSSEINTQRVAIGLGNSATPPPSTVYKSESTPKRKTPGRPLKAEQLSRDPNNSSPSIPELFRNYSNKRGRDLDKQSPPSKVQRSSSSPPAINSMEPSTQVSFAPIPIITEPAFNCSSFTDLLKQMHAWRIEDREYLNKMKEMISEEITSVQNSNTELIKATKAEFTAANAHLSNELDKIKTRLTTLESQNTPGSNLNLSNDTAINKKIANAAISSVEKHLRRNNAIIAGLVVKDGNVLNSVNEFVKSNFGISNSATCADIIGKNKPRIKVTFKDSSTKSQIMSKKKSLKVPVYINHDLTPEEGLAAKKIRDFGKSALSEGKKVKFSHLKVNIDGISYTYDPVSNSVTPASSSYTLTHNHSDLPQEQNTDMHMVTSNSPPANF